ncbi:peptidyl-prolyl cis-trans isomerase [Metabacillus sp. KIGAM252]|uniref:peptidylprolyl isomerase n=1 Tax=Metabacillus flavus TaxID=2823519 RepID=A0ABS5L9A3_9BACI|nr:peptidyl-prolyl cis-trans isomerase [Metabacillus flavus]MBS2967288.1 peptidyl-prolyl cis-trans isomerase [Metabacillus flavus]
MNKRALWFVIIGLAVLNLGTFLYFMKKEPAPAESSETVAKIGQTEVTREEWLAQLENRFGKETLEQMVNSRVVEELSKKYKINVKDETIDRELDIFKASSNVTESEGLENEKEWRKQIRYSILLEELLTRDVNVSEEAMKTYYSKNKAHYTFEDAYHLSHIALRSEKQAEEVINELKAGSSFQALAEEHASAAEQQGDLGFITEGQASVPRAYMKAAGSMKAGGYSGQPVKTEKGYAVLFLNEKINGRTYSYNEVKEQIRRQLALEQMEGEVSVKPLWEEAKAEWFYGQKD